MENLEILKPDDIRLSQKCSEITDFENPFYKEIIDQICHLCVNKFNCYAVAAVQFGIMKRFIVIMRPEEKTDMEQENEYVAIPYFNPKITKREGKQYYFEACLSTGDAIGRVARPYVIMLEAQDIKGNKISRQIEGFEAIIFSHEIDHLDGIRFTDKALEIYHIPTEEERIAFRKEHPLEIITKEGEFIEEEKTKVLKKA